MFSAIVLPLASNSNIGVPADVVAYTQAVFLPDMALAGRAPESRALLGSAVWHLPKQYAQNLGEAVAQPASARVGVWLRMILTRAGFPGAQPADYAFKRLRNHLDRRDPGAVRLPVFGPDDPAGPPPVPPAATLAAVRQQLQGVPVVVPAVIAAFAPAPAAAGAAAAPRPPASRADHGIALPPAIAPVAPPPPPVVLPRVGPPAPAAAGIAQAQHAVVAFVARDLIQDVEDASRAHGGFFDVPDLPAVLQGNTHPWVAAATAAQRAQVNAMVDRLASAVPVHFLLAHRARASPLSAIPYFDVLNGHFEAHRDLCVRCWHI